VCNVGHCNQQVTAAIRAQARELVHVSNLYYTENQGRLAEKLSKLSLGGKCFFCNSGAEANEAQIKLARLWGHDAGKYEVITMKNSFHGRTLATAAATGQVKIQKGFEPMPVGFSYADFNNLDSIRALITDRTAAVLVEAVQGEGGIIPATPEFMTGLRALCNEKNILMLCDEVQCGMGRTGNWFGFQAYGVQPDAFSMAKALGSGYPIGAVIGTCAAMEGAHTSFISSSYWTEGVGPAAALATVRKMCELNLPAHCERIGRKVMDAWRASAARHGLPVKVDDGYPALAHFAFEAELAQELKTLYVQSMLERGFLATLAIYVTLAHTDEVVEMYAEAIDEVFAELAEALERGEVKKRLKGPVVHSGFRRLL